MVDFKTSLPAESVPPMCVTTPVVEESVVMVEQVIPAPVVSHSCSRG